MAGGAPALQRLNRDATMAGGQAQRGYWGRDKLVPPLTGERKNDGSNCKVLECSETCQDAPVRLLRRVVNPARM
jgi:hypothetical protein